MSDEARDAYLQWLDKCAKEQETDYETWLEGRVAQLEAENAALSELLSPLVDVELERDTLKSALDVAMSENQRLTKHVEDYEEEVFYEDKEGRGVRYKDWCQQLQNDNALLEAELAKYKGEWEKEEYRCPQCGLGNPRVAQLKAKIALLSKNYSALCTKCGYMRPATEIEKENAILEAKLTAIECAGCGKTMLECECDEVE